MRQLLKKNTHFFWSSEINEEFEEVKKHLTQHCFLKQFDPKRTSIVMCDSNKTRGIGWVLGQADNEDEWARKKPRIDIIRCGSLSAKKSWKFMSPLITEALGISIAMDKLHWWVRASAKPVQILTDHRPIKFLMHSTSMEDLSDKMGRIKESMMKYNYKINYINSSKIIMSDTLGREPNDPASEIGEDVLQTKDEELRCCMAHTFTEVERIVDDPMLTFLFEEATDKEYTDMVEAIKQGKEANEAKYSI